MFQHIISNASIDFNKREIHDIQTAVNKMLQKIRTRVNRRQIFNITSVIPTGSVIEQSSIWKFHFDGQNYHEFDFLAWLENSIQQCEYQDAQNKCQGCINSFYPLVK